MVQEQIQLDYRREHPEVEGLLHAAVCNLELRTPSEGDKSRSHQMSCA